MSRIKNFSDFVNESYSPLTVNEGFISGLKKYAGLAFGWGYQLLKNIINGLIAPIPHGPKKGLPTIMLFLPEYESIYNQMNKFERGIDPLKESEAPVKIGNTEELPIEYTKEEGKESTGELDPKDSIIELYDKKYQKEECKNIFIQGKDSRDRVRIIGGAGDTLGIPVLIMELKYIKADDLLKKSKENLVNVLPTDNGQKDRGGIIYLEDFDKADKNIMAYLNELVKSGEVEGYRLPDKWIIVASGDSPDQIGDISGFELKK